MQVPTESDSLFYLAQTPGPGIVQLTIRADLVSAVKPSWKPPPSHSQCLLDDPKSSRLLH